jgi:hypothetical protein
LAILQHAKIERIPNLKKALIHKLICRYNPLKSSTRLPEDPKFFTFDAETVRACEKEKLSVPLAGETYFWETPFPGCS